MQRQLKVKSKPQVTGVLLMGRVERDLATVDPIAHTEQIRREKQSKEGKKCISALSLIHI